MVSFNNGWLEIKLRKQLTRYMQDLRGTSIVWVEKKRELRKIRT